MIKQADKMIKKTGKIRESRQNDKIKAYKTIKRLAFFDMYDKLYLL